MNVLICDSCHHEKESTELHEKCTWCPDGLMVKIGEVDWDGTFNLVKGLIDA